MTGVIFRAVLLLVCLASGALSGPGFASGALGWSGGVLAGAAVFGALLWLERKASAAAPQALAGVGCGALAGLVAAALAQGAGGFALLPPAAVAGAALALAYVGAVAGMRCSRLLKLPGAVHSSSTSAMLLDTSAIIDGRVVDLLELGFIGGHFVVPQFVLNELQGIADSADPIKRARGRRGLSVLERLQGAEGADVRVPDQDFPGLKAVDAKMVAFAKATGATLVTNDFNLSKVAELQGVHVLNIHQLSLALRPALLPGEEVAVSVQKLGKEAGQGVGYLEDGTMVVVDGGSSRLGSSVRTVVTSVLQTTSGRMVFSRLAEDGGVPEVAEKRAAARGRS